MKYIAIFISIVIGFIGGFAISKSLPSKHIYPTALVDHEETALRQDLWILKTLDDGEYSRAKELVKNYIDYHNKESSVFLSLPADQGTIDVYKHTLRRVKCALENHTLTAKETFELQDLATCSKNESNNSLKRDRPKAAAP